MLAATLLTVVSSDKQAKRQYGVPPNLDAIPDEPTAFRHFAEGRTSSLSLASAILASKLDIRNGRWTTSFNLVVGDTFEDRMMFWNGRLFIPTFLDDDLCCARVTLNDLRDDAFLATLVELINRRNFVNGGSDSQSQLTIRSVSLTPKELDEACTLVKSARPWSVTTMEAVPTVDALVPTDQSLKVARESNQLAGSVVPKSGWKAFNWPPPFCQTSGSWAGPYC